MTSLYYRKLCKNLALPKKKTTHHHNPLPSHLAKIWPPNPALGATNLRAIIWISPTGKGEAGRDACFDLISCPSLCFHSAEEKSRWTAGPTQPPGSGRKLERCLKRNENWCKPFAEGYAATEAVPSPWRTMMRYPTCSLVRCVQAGTDLRAANKLICIRLNCQSCPPSPCPLSLPRSVTHIKPNKDKCVTEFIRVIENQDGAAYFSSMLSQEIKINSPTSYFNIAYHNHR